MADTGILYPSATGFSVFSLSTNTWTNPTNGYIQDGSFATHAPSAFNEYQSYGDFNVNIPQGNRLTGIEVLVVAKTSDNTNFISAFVCRKTSGNTRMFIGFDTLVTSLESYYFGGDGTLPTGDTAGDWTLSHTSNSEFCVLIQDLAVSNPTWTTSVDSVAIRIYYEKIPGGFMNWFN